MYNILNFRRKKNRDYNMDSSGIIHMASMNKNYSNTFRISITLNEKVDKEILQKALDNITPRFPTIVAGIRRGWFNYYVSPVVNPPKVRKDSKTLSVMTKKMVKNCAMQVLYKDNKVSVEIFHSLTDGNGGVVFLNSLVAEYLTLRYNVQVQYSDRILNPYEGIKLEELSDSYLENLGKAEPANHENVFKIPGGDLEPDNNHIISRMYKTDEMLKVSRSYGVSLTTFITGVMAQSILELEEKMQSKKKIQIMVPVNLRKKFESKTLYNFSLYALPQLNHKDVKLSMEQLLDKLSGQLKSQFTKEHLQGQFTMNVKALNFWWFKILPLELKDMVLKFVYHMYGERNSCITVSNLGEITFPPELEKYIRGIECALMPRRNAPYNCGIVSFNGNLCISLSRKGIGCGLEEIFYRKTDEFRNLVLG